ncbi:MULTISPECIES: hypothetical protein [unclassified Streptomyces]|nr:MULTISPECIES: hypothetical protein [unclassified Streptomyces]MCX5332650.1 hypothetical protein [Streptomyces sp. NBC_00140]MCX5362048.1 hypothetical protein [Streptomyces sp. NBC_00124]
MTTSSQRWVQVGGGLLGHSRPPAVSANQRRPSGEEELGPTP